MANKRLIWSSNVDIKNWEEYLNEEYPEVTDTYEKYELCCRMNEDYLEDEKENLNIKTNPIVCIADLGLWNGRRQGIKKVGNNINEIFCTQMRGEIEWNYDRYNVMGIENHHDGSNYYIYRELKGDTVEQQERNYERLVNQIMTTGNLSSDMITKCTKSIRHYVVQVYGA